MSDSSTSDAPPPSGSLSELGPERYRPLPKYEGIITKFADHRRYGVRFTIDGSSTGYGFWEDQSETTLANPLAVEKLLDKLREKLETWLESHQIPD